MEKFLCQSRKIPILNKYIAITPRICSIGYTLEDDIAFKAFEREKVDHRKYPKFARANPHFQWETEGNGGGITTHIC